VNTNFGSGSSVSVLVIFAIEILLNSHKHYVKNYKRRKRKEKRTARANSEISDLTPTLNDAVLASLRAGAPLVALVDRQAGWNGDAPVSVVRKLGAHHFRAALDLRRVFRQRLLAAPVAALAPGRRVVGYRHPYARLRTMKNI
jgi:hypothetical protein